MAFEPCPDPLARAPRGATATSEWLRMPPAGLHGALVAFLHRDTSGTVLDAAQRLSHFPASPVVTLSWFRGMDVGVAWPGGCWAPFGPGVIVSGSLSEPTVTWARTTGVGCVACFQADAARLLFGLDLAAIQDRFLPARDAIGPEFTPLWDALLSGADADAPAVLERHLAPRWQAAQGRADGRPSLRHLGRHWVQRLAWQAHEWSRAHGPRQVERRIKAFSGRSLREWQGLVRAEGLFFAARERYDAGLAPDWADLAHAEGFSDQAHMSRVMKRMTGFAPTEFTRRFAEDESFWMYRLWV